MRDRGDPRRPARVRLDREGARHADGGAEVRPGEGGAVPEPVPDQPVEDGRRALRPAAHGADWALQPVARWPSVIVVTGPSGAGKGTLIRELLERVPELELAVSATTRTAGRARRTARVLVPLRARVRPRGSSRRVPRARQVRLRASATARCAPRSSGSRDEGRIPVLELETEGALKVAEESPAPSRSSSRPRSPSSSGGCASARPRARARSASGSTSPGSSSSRRGRFDHVVENDDLERAVERARGPRPRPARAGR